MGAFSRYGVLPAVLAAFAGRERVIVPRRHVARRASSAGSKSLTLAHLATSLHAGVERPKGAPFHGRMGIRQEGDSRDADPTFADMG